jgi:hypothetical protein
MNSTLVTTVQVINPGLPSTLISTEYSAQVEAIAQYLPGGMTAFFGFECRLDDAVPGADFLLAVTATEGGRDILAGASPNAGLPGMLQAQPIWRRLINFCQDWANPDSPLHAHIHNLWLEFDIVNQQPDITAPNCFFGLCLRAGDANRWVVDTAIPLLHGASMPSDLAQNVRTCLEALPERAYVFQIGLMLARQVEAVRLCVRDIAPAQIVAYLSHLGWPGKLDSLAALLADLSRRVDRIDLDLDVGPTVLPKIGLECYFNNQVQPQAEPRWRSFLEFLEAKGLCCPAKREGLLAYPGYIREKADQAGWPAHLLTTARFLGNRYESIFFKGLHHIKVVYQPEYLLEAKAYLYVGQSWLPKKASSPVSSL